MVFTLFDLVSRKGLYELCVFRMYCTIWVFCECISGELGCCS
jgi:hypothetical protein